MASTGWNQLIQEVLTQLAQLPLFSSLSSNELDEIARQSRPRNYCKGEWLAHYDESWMYLFWVEKGRIAALKESSEGRSLIAATIVKQEIFWGVGFFHDNAPMPVGLFAEEESKIRLWSREQLLPYLLRDGEMAWELSRQMVTRMLQVSDVVDNLAFRAVPGRLANLLLDHYSGSGDKPVARDMTLDQMAAHIGSTREMVCRALYKFADKGAIKINRTEFILTDEDKLTDIAQRN